jgi:signal transduction histidine kinase
MMEKYKNDFNFATNQLNFLIDKIFLLLNNQNNYENLLNKTINLFGSFPCCDEIALFFLNNETFDFDFSTSYPKIKQEYFENVFISLVQKGAVGKALNSGESFFYTENKTENNYIIIPIVAISEIKGVFIIVTQVSLSDIELTVIKTYNILSKVFGLILENRELQIKQNKSKDLLDQLIASRTIHLVENYKKLGDKIETLKATLSMSIPHEVRTPINQILGFSNYLISYYSDKIIEDKEDIIEILNDIKNSGERLKNLFENFIYFTRLSIISTSLKEIEELQNKISFYCDSVIYDQAMIKAQEYGRMEDLEINLVSSNISISEEYLAKLINELMDNAMKFSPINSKVNLHSNIDGKFYNIVIKDNGIGFDKEHIQDIDGYMQFDRLANEQQGIGLGMAIVQRIIDLHNGVLTIKSLKDKFTEVSVKIPVAENAVLNM